METIFNKDWREYHRFTAALGWQDFSEIGKVGSIKFQFLLLHVRFPNLNISELLFSDKFCSVARWTGPDSTEHSPTPWKVAIITKVAHSTLLKLWYWRKKDILHQLIKSFFCPKNLFGDNKGIRFYTENSIQWLCRMRDFWNACLLSENYEVKCSMEWSFEPNEPDGPIPQETICTSRDGKWGRGLSNQNSVITFSIRNWQKNKQQLSFFL